MSSSSGPGPDVPVEVDFQENWEALEDAIRNLSHHTSFGLSGPPFGTTCGICLIEVEQNDDGKALPCGHVFHTDACLTQALRICRLVCPNCNADIFEETVRIRLLGERHLNQARHLNEESDLGEESDFGEDEEDAFANIPESLLDLFDRVAVLRVRHQQLLARASVNEVDQQTRDNFMRDYRDLIHDLAREQNIFIHEAVGEIRQHFLAIASVSNGAANIHAFVHRLLQAQSMLEEERFNVSGTNSREEFLYYDRLSLLVASMRVASRLETETSMMVQGLQIVSTAWQIALPPLDAHRSFQEHWEQLERQLPD